MYMVIIDIVTEPILPHCTQKQLAAQSSYIKFRRAIQILWTIDDGYLFSSVLALSQHCTSNLQTNETSVSAACIVWKYSGKYIGQ